MRKNAAAPIIKIPSTVIPQEYNYLITPAHKDSRLIKVLDIHDRIYDVRIKTV